MKRTGWLTGWAKGTGAWVGSAQRAGNAWGERWAVEVAACASFARVGMMHSGDNARQKRGTAREADWSFRDFGTKTTPCLDPSLLLGSERGVGVGFPPGTLSPC